MQLVVHSLVPLLEHGSGAAPVSAVEISSGERIEMVAPATLEPLAAKDAGVTQRRGAAASAAPPAAPPAAASAPPPAAPLVVAARESPYAEHPVTWPLHLFFDQKFGVHRVLGLLYLVQYALAWRLYAMDAAAFAASALLYTLPLNGVLQSLTATYYFSFLPKRADPGYYSDKSALSYDFVKENIFYSSILAWQWLYMDARNVFGGAGAPAGRAPALALALEAAEHAWVFLPYLLFRNLVPKTSFRDSLKNDKNKSEGNAVFFRVATLVTKFFYVWAKWYIGFFFNYLRYLDLISAAQLRNFYCLLLFSAFATTISMFLHTLKFKGYIGPKTAFLIYMASYLATFYSIVVLHRLFLDHLPLVAITAGGLALNYWGDKIMCGSRASRDLPGGLYQVATMALLWAVRDGRLPEAAAWLRGGSIEQLAAAWAARSS